MLCEQSFHPKHLRYESAKDPDECLLTDVVEFPAQLEELVILGGRVDTDNFTLKFLTKLPHLSSFRVDFVESPKSIRNLKYVSRTLLDLRISWSEEGPITGSNNSNNETSVESIN